MLGVLGVLNVLNVLHVLHMLMDASLALWALLHLYWGFLDASSHLYKRVCPSVRRSVVPLVTL